MYWIIFANQTGFQNIKKELLVERNKCVHYIQKRVVISFIFHVF